MRRFLRVLKFVGLALTALIAVLLIWFAVANTRASARLEQKLAALRAAGQPVRLAELAREPIPPEENAVTYLQRAKSDIQALENELYAYIEAASPADQEAFEKGRLTPELAKRMRSAIEAHLQVFALVEQASQCPDYDLQFEFNLAPSQFLEKYLPEMGNFRAVIRILNYRALLQLSEGQPAEALANFLTILRLAQLYDHNPLIVHNLISLACRGIAIQVAELALRAGPLPAASHDALEAELTRHDLAKAAQQALRTERAFGLSNLSRYPWIVFMKLPQGKNDACDYIDLIDQMIAMFGLPVWDPAGRTSRAKFESMLYRAGPLTSSAVPAWRAWQTAICRSQAQLRCLRVLNALQRRDRVSNENAGEPKLSALGLPVEAITDPFNGEPLHLKKLPDGWLIYSVGMNLKDDGGKLNEENEDVGLGPPSAKIADEKPAG